jgi:threonine dehydrogenase-like Zn-dependent dehydrogenase
VIQGSGPLGILAVAAAQEMGAGWVICVGAPEAPRLRLACKFGAEAPVHRCKFDRDVMAPHLHQGPQRAGLVEIHRHDLPLGAEMLYRTRDKYPWLEMQTLYSFSEEGIGRAAADAMAMKTVKSTISASNSQADQGPLSVARDLSCVCSS